MLGAFEVGSGYLELHRGAVLSQAAPSSTQIVPPPQNAIPTRAVNPVESMGSEP